MAKTIPDDPVWMPVFVPEADVDKRTEESYVTPLTALTSRRAWLDELTTALAVTFQDTVILDVQGAYGASGANYNKPAGTIVATYVVMVGAGGGGGGGGGNGGGGGQGGASGFCLERFVPELPDGAVMFSTVGGAGGDGTSSPGGNPGSSPPASTGISHVDFTLSVPGGQGGAGGNESPVYAVPELARLTGQQRHGDTGGGVSPIGALIHGGYANGSDGSGDVFGGGGAGGYLSDAVSASNGGSSAPSTGGQGGVGYGAGGGGGAGGLSSDGANGGQGAPGAVEVYTWYIPS